MVTLYNYLKFDDDDKICYVVMINQLYCWVLWYHSYYDCN